MWDLDPLKNERIENKRTELKILYSSKVDRWLDKYHDLTPKRRFLIEAGLVLSGKIKTLSMKILEPLERMLHNTFSTQTTCAIDLCSDEDEVELVEPRSPPVQEIKPAQVKSSAAPTVSTPVIIDNDSEDEVQVVQDLPPPVQMTTRIPRLDLCTPPLSSSGSSYDPPETFQVPIPESIALSPESLDLSAPEETPLAASSATKQRRKSVNSRPSSSKDLPSISDYKIKTPLLKPPSVYAKTAEEVPRGSRQIISVPYKNPVRQAQVAYDPRAESQRLAEIKEKIYARKYLSIDVAHKIEMQKKLEEEKLEEEKLAEENERKAENSNDSSDNSVEEEVTLKKRRRESTNKPRAKRRKKDANGTGSSKDEVQPLRETRQKGKKQKVPVQSKPRPKSPVNAASKVKKSPQKSNLKKSPIKKKKPPVSKQATKKRKQRLLSSDDDKDYIAPSHVLDPIEAELEAMQNGPRWVRQESTTESNTAESNEVESPNSSFQDPFKEFVRTYPGSDAAETNNNAIADQSFNEDSLLVEIPCDPKKFRKPYRTSRLVPNFPAASRPPPPKPKTGKRGRPKRRVAVDEIEIKVEPACND